MEIMKADKGYKRKCLKIMALSGVAGLFLVGYVLPRATEYIESLPIKERLDLILLLITILILSFIPLGLYFCLFAKKIYKTGQYPPIGHKVFRDTRVYRGKPARQRALLLLITGLILISTTVFSATYFPAKFREMAQKSNHTIKADKK